MDNSRKQLLEVVEEQKKTIEKYTNKLRDVVAAHKSLLVEKKALEDTIKILNAEKDNETTKEKPTEVNVSESSLNEASEAELKNQLSSLLKSFSDLVTEKSHMEECFKSNQKQLLEEKRAIENKYKELQEQVKFLKSVENNTHNEFLFVKKESKKSAKNSKHSYEGKDKSKSLDNELVSQVKNYEKEIKNLQSELESKRIIYEATDKKLKESSVELSKLQEEVRNLQIEHEMAISNEKEKAKSVEEHAKKLTAVQEERVFNLETRLAELSETIGSYDRLRLQDQIEIQKLKEHITFIDVGHKGLNLDHQKPDINLNDYEGIKEKFLEFKKLLQSAAQKNDKEDDLKNLFNESSNSEDVHLQCKEEYNKLKAEFEYFKNDIVIPVGQGKSTKEVVELQNQVKNLQEKIKIVSDKNKEIEKEYKLQIEQLKKTLKNEKSRYKDMISSLENDHKARVWLLEEQLQKQRKRSLALLEEKEQEIHTLQSTFQMFLPGYMGSVENESKNEANVPLVNQFVDGPHIVHYANELARRDVEISSLRRSKHQTEMSLREVQKDLASAVEKMNAEKESLMNEISRLERCQTREGANLEYLKNVVYNFLLSSDPKSKRHMCNAIAAVLKFSDSEVQKVINHSKNSWWTRSNMLR